MNSRESASSLFGLSYKITQSNILIILKQRDLTSVNASVEFIFLFLVGFISKIPVASINFEKFLLF